MKSRKSLGMLRMLYTAVAAALPAMETRQQLFAESPEKKWCLKPVAALVAGLVMSLLVPTFALAQHTVGSLYFVNRADGSEAFGYFDRYGYFQQTCAIGPLSALVGITDVVNTPNGILVYNADNGQATLVQIGDGLPGVLCLNTIRGLGYTFAAGWSKIVSVGDYLLFYNDDGSGAIGHIAADGSFTQTQYSPPGSYSHWTHIVATNNNLFFYNSIDGTSATGYIEPFGTFVTTQSLQLPIGYDFVVSDGNFLLLYSQQPGPAKNALIGVIDGRPGKFLPTASVSLPAGYNMLVKHDGYLLLYNSNAGGGTIGYVDRISAGAKFIVTQQPAFSPYWTRIVSTNDDLLFYNTVTGSAAVGRIDRNGRFQQTPQVLRFSTGWFGVVATTR